MRAMRAYALTAALGAGGLVAAPPPAAAQKQSVEQLKAQGKLYFKREMYKQAMGTLNKAWSSKAGQNDFDVAFYRARTAYALLLLEVAFETVDKAIELAADARDRASAQGFKDEMSSLFGALNVVPGQGETNAEGRIFFESKTGMVNKEKKARFEAIQRRFRETDIALPRTVFLPYGKYTANNVPFEIVQGEAAPTVEVFLQVRRDDGDDDDDGGALWWYVGGGAVAAAALGVGAVFLLNEPEPEIIRGVPIKVEGDR